MILCATPSLDIMMKSNPVALPLLPLILLFCGIIFSPTVSAQSPPTPSQLAFIVESLQGPDLLLQLGAGGQIDSSTLSRAGIAIMTLSDLSQVDSIHLKLGTTSGGNELFQQAFSPSALNAPNPHQAYRRIGDKCIIRLGLFSLTDFDVSTLYLEAQTENSTGTMGTASSVTYTP